MISFLFDFVMKWRGTAAEIESFQTAAAALWEGYADPSTAPEVLEFFQKFSALNGWSGLQGRNLTDQNKRHKLQRLQQLAQTCLLAIAR